VDIRIGLVHSLRELEVELADDTDAVALQKQVDEVLRAGGGILWLTDRKGAQFAIAAEKVTFIQLGTGSEKGRIGFG
jgi:hypothetical protein